MLKTSTHCIFHAYQLLLIKYIVFYKYLIKFESTPMADTTIHPTTKPFPSYWFLVFVFTFLIKTQKT